MCVVICVVLCYMRMCVNYLSFLAGNCTLHKIDIGDVLYLRQQLFYIPETTVS
jgi:hypothetical protein